MITLDNTQTSKKSQSNSPLSLSSKDEPKLSFSDLLKGISDKKDAKVIQNGALVLAIDDKDVKSTDIADTKTLSKKETLLSMLKNDVKTPASKEESVEIDPKFTQNIASVLDAKEIKKLIFDAKKYLKEQILNSEGYKKLEQKELPKTLKGLATLATKLGIDISKITIEKVQPQNITTSNIPSQNPKIENLELKNSIKEPLSKESKTTLKDVKERVVDENLQKNQNIDEKQHDKLSKEVLTQPIFKSTKPSELSTEQFVQARSVVNEKQPNNKTNTSETLQMLLRGEKEGKAETILNKDISTVASNVISTQPQSENVKTLESLLHGDSVESSTKQDGGVVIKSDSLDVKIKEAKQMVRYLSQDVKQAIEDYKSPFTRIKVQLNPQKLGEVDLTVVQRGKNLVVTLSSNNAAINTLAMNANELRAQLSNSGINNATLNFNNSSQSDFTNSSGTGQNNQNGQKAHKEYNYFENEERNEEVLSSLEISVPYYA